MMQNVYYIHLFNLYPDEYKLDTTQWLCRDCASARHLTSAYIQLRYAVNGSEVCEKCGAKQISFQVGAAVIRKGKPGAIGRLIGLAGSKLAVDWPAPQRIGGDGWHRSAVSFKVIVLHSQ